jgi:hypothetical protein
MRMKSPTDWKYSPQPMNRVEPKDQRNAESRFLDRPLLQLVSGAGIVQASSQEVGPDFTLTVLN